MSRCLSNESIKKIVAETFGNPEEEDKEILAYKKFAKSYYGQTGNSTLIGLNIIADKPQKELYGINSIVMFGSKMFIKAAEMTKKFIEEVCGTSEDFLCMIDIQNSKLCHVIGEESGAVNFIENLGVDDEKFPILMCPIYEGSIIATIPTKKMFAKTSMQT